MENEFKKTNKQKLTALLVILVIIAAGFGIFSYLMHHKKKITRRKPHQITIYVKTQKAKMKDTNYQIPAYGRIKPEKEVTIRPMVSGDIVHINPLFYEGGFIKKNEVLAKIDESDYRLAAAVKKAKLRSLTEDLKIQTGKNRAAKAELAYAKKFIKHIDKNSRYLILQKPYLQKIINSIKMAKAELADAELDLKRTAIRAPFDAYILDKYVDRGSVVSTSSKIANLVYADEFYVEMLINYNDLKHINFDSSTKAKISIGNRYTFAVFKSASRSTDESGSAAKLIFLLKPAKETENLIIINGYVPATILGKKLKNIFSIPVSALRDDDTVWLYENSKLHIKKIDVVFKSKKYAYTYDLNKNDEIVTSNIALPIEGIKLKKINKNGQ